MAGIQALQSIHRAYASQRSFATAPTSRTTMASVAPKKVSFASTEMAEHSVVKALETSPIFKGKTFFFPFGEEGLLRRLESSPVENGIRTIAVERDYQNTMPRADRLFSQGEFYLADVNGTYVLQSLGLQKSLITNITVPLLLDEKTTSKINPEGVFILSRPATHNEQQILIPVLNSQSSKESMAPDLSVDYGVVVLRGNDAYMYPFRDNSQTFPNKTPNIIGAYKNSDTPLGEVYATPTKSHLEVVVTEASSISVVTMSTYGQPVDGKRPASRSFAGANVIETTGNKFLFTADPATYGYATAFVSSKDGQSYVISRPADPDRQGGALIEIERTRFPWIAQFLSKLPFNSHAQPIAHTPEKG